MNYLRIMGMQRGCVACFQASEAFRAYGLRHVWALKRLNSELEFVNARQPQNFPTKLPMTSGQDSRNLFL